MCDLSGLMPKVDTQEKQNWDKFARSQNAEAMAPSPMEALIAIIVLPGLTPGVLMLDTWRVDAGDWVDWELFSSYIFVIVFLAQIIEIRSSDQMNLKCRAGNWHAHF